MQFKMHMITGWNSWLRRNDDDSLEATFFECPLFFDLGIGRPGDSTPTWSRLQDYWSTTDVPCELFESLVGQNTVGFGTFNNFGASIPVGFIKLEITNTSVNMVLSL